MISDKTIDAVRDLPIEDVLKSYGLQFRRRGSTWFASCPFHQERTPLSPSLPVRICGTATAATVEATASSSIWR